MQVYKRVFILGSGFSKSFCPTLPTLKDLNDLLPNGIPAEYAHLKAYCERFFKLCNKERDYMNMESIATAILSSRIFSGEAEKLYYLALRFELLRFIASVIGEHAPLEYYAKRTLTHFLQSASADDSIESSKTLLLTFNYDTLLEDLILQSEEFKNTAINFGVRLKSADFLPARKCDKRIDLIKLHGSLEWYPLKGAGDTLDVGNICQVRKEDESFPIYKNDTPVFIPMAHSKQSFLHGSLFNILWAKADYYLSTASEIYCIGYGFPKTDINNLEFLLKHSERLKNVVVYEDSFNADLMRIQKLFGKKVINEDAKKWIENFTA